MQRTFVAITLALTLSCALAVFTPTNYVKTPIQVVQNNETNYTNATNGQFLQLNSINAGELDILAPTYTANAATPVNTSANSWNLVYRKLDAKALTGTANTTLAFVQPATVSYGNGYVYSVVAEKDSSNTSQVNVYQTQVSNAAVVQRITLSNNTNVNVTLGVLASPAIGKVVYVFYSVNGTQVNVSSFTVGGAKGSLTFNITTAYTGGLTVAWGEALGSSTLYANWLEGTDALVLRYTTIDVTKGTTNVTSAVSWSNSSSCRAFSTDKKWYGDFCTYINTTENVNTINYYIRFNSSTVLPFNNNATLFSNTSSLVNVYPYGPYLAVFYVDTVTTAGAQTYSYELWNLDTLVVNKAKTTFLVSDLTVNSFFRVVSGGLYSLSYSYNATNDNSTVHFSNIQVGQVLGSSYLTSVLGFIMTIVAGVLLF